MAKELWNRRRPESVVFSVDTPDTAPPPGATPALRPRGHWLERPRGDRVVARLSFRAVGLLLLTLSITTSSCQALFPRDDTVNAPQQLSPGFFESDGP